MDLSKPYLSPCSMPRVHIDVEESVDRRRWYVAPLVSVRGDENDPDTPPARREAARAQRGDGPRRDRERVDQGSAAVLQTHDEVPGSAGFGNTHCRAGHEAVAAADREPFRTIWVVPAMTSGVSSFSM